MGGRNGGATIKVAGTRKWFRSIVEDKTLRAKVEEIIQAAVEEGNLTDYWKAVEHGFGRPPQALDIKTQHVEPRVVPIFPDGQAVFAEDAALSSPRPDEPSN